MKIFISSCFAALALLASWFSGAVISKRRNAAFSSGEANDALAEIVDQMPILPLETSSESLDASAESEVENGPAGHCGGASTGPPGP